MPCWCAAQSSAPLEQHFERSRPEQKDLVEAELERQAIHKRSKGLEALLAVLDLVKCFEHESYGLELLELELHGSWAPWCADQELSCVQ